MLVHMVQKTAGANLGLSLGRKRGWLSVAALAAACGGGEGTAAQARVTSGGLQLHGKANQGPHMDRQICSWTRTEGAKAALFGFCATTHDTHHYHLSIGEYTRPSFLEASGGPFVDKATRKVQKNFGVPSIVHTMPSDALQALQDARGTQPSYDLILATVAHGVRNKPNGKSRANRLQKLKGCLSTSSTGCNSGIASVPNIRTRAMSDFATAYCAFSFLSISPKVAP